MVVDDCSFDTYGCPPPINVIYLTNRGIYSKNQIQKNDSYCASYCSNVADQEMRKTNNSSDLLKIISPKSKEPQPIQNPKPTTNFSNKNKKETRVLRQNCR